LLSIELREQLINISEALDLMNQLINDSRGVEPFIKSLKVQEFGHLLYILYPVTFSFTNLTQLEIFTCTLPLIALLRIGESLKKLKKLILKTVLLIEFENQELTSSLVYFPTSLDELDLNFFTIVTLNPKLSDIYIARNQYYKEYIKTSYFTQLKASSLKRLYTAYIKPDYVLILLNLNQNVEEITIKDSDLDQRIIDKFSTMKSLNKLSIQISELESPAITSRSGLIFPQFNFITDLAVGFSEYMYKSKNEFLYFTNHFPNLTQLSIDITNLNFENIDIGRFFLETLPSYQNLEILTLVYMNYEEEYNLNWLKFINVDCLILDFTCVYPDEIDFSIFSYKIREIRKKMSNVKFELECIDYCREMFDKWTITYDEKYIYFNK
jgi:hypothetical protein